MDGLRAVHLFQTKFWRVGFIETSLQIVSDKESQSQCVVNGKLRRGFIRRKAQYAIQGLICRNLET
jgi:hypothetical protein